MEVTKVRKENKIYHKHALKSIQRSCTRPWRSTSCTTCY